MSGYPIQPSKIQQPPLRDETLARDRLLDWLHAKVHHRVIYVIAEAGYGKTTLLADFSRRTRLRTLWYRLDDQDASWIAFLSHLVAAGREHDPDFAPATSGLLQDLATAGPSLETALETFIREFQVLGENGVVLILDDFHLVDDAPDVRLIMRELLARAPERVTFIVASRRTPSLPVARLRGQGEVAELTTDDLRFNEAETEQLFRETYGRPLEPDVLTDLSRRTEGWAASLQLVQAAIRNRTSSEIRSFVRSLSGAEGDLYDYLAEEVIGALPLELQRFLMRLAILETVSKDLLLAVTELDEPTGRGLHQQAERAGLVTKRSDSALGPGFHPLVRQFLLHRLRREIGDAGVRELHIRAAEASTSWMTACHHLSEADRPVDVHRRLAESIREVLGGGRFHVAGSLLERHPPSTWSLELAVIGSRARLQRGDVSGALVLGEHAHRLVPSSAIAALNYASLLMMVGRIRESHAVARQISRTGLDPVISDIAASTEAAATLDYGNLDDFVEHTVAMAQRQASAGLEHYEGISLLNAAVTLRAQGKANPCLELASRARELLDTTGAVFEAISARLVKAWALAHLARWQEAVSEFSGLRIPEIPVLREEAFGEEAAVHVWYGDSRHAALLLAALQAAPAADGQGRITHLVAAELAMRQGDWASARDSIDSARQGEPTREPGFEAHRLAVQAYLAAATGDSSAASSATAALTHAEKQGAWYWHTYCQLLVAFSAPSRAHRLPPAVRTDPAYISVLAELVTDRLATLDDDDRAIVSEEAARRPERWRPALRSVAGDRGHSSRWAAAQLLDLVGERSDIALLRGVAKDARGSSAARYLGKGLARRLAPRIAIEDQGRVQILVGRQLIDGSSMRRKVLALLCFLTSRPNFAATRDEALDALWPELEPEIAINSLNQTVYFLRRVFEPEYQETTSPGYVQFDSNVLWLDSELISSRSATCAALIRGFQGEADPSEVEELVASYRGRFAMDFAYDEWSIPYRETLHAAYLQIVEAAVTTDTRAGYYDRGIRLARAALEIDPAAEPLETSLVRLYRLSGAHAAAAEQYAHYAAVLRDELGVDPPALEAL